MKEQTLFLNPTTAIIAKSDISSYHLAQYKETPVKIKGNVYIICTKGTMNVTINLKNFTIKENDFITLFGDNFIHIHEYSSDISISGVWFSPKVMHKGDFFYALDSILLIFENPIRQATESLKSYVHKSISALEVIKETEETSNNQLIIKSIMDVYFHISMTLYGMDKPKENLFTLTKSHEINRQFIKLATKNYKTERSISFYAEKTGTSKENLCRIVKSCSHKTPLSIIDALLILDAKSQLKSTPKTVTDIALSLGFDNLTAFCRFFRKYEKVSPLDYRNQQE